MGDLQVLQFGVKSVLLRHSSATALLSSLCVFDI